MTGLFRKNRIWWLILSVVIGFGATAFCIHELRRAKATEYSTFPSPDGRYKVVVYRLPTFTIAISGAGGEAPGYVRLLDNSGKVLVEKDLEMVQDIDRVDWQKDRVYLSGGQEWMLPDKK